MANRSNPYTNIHLLILLLARYVLLTTVIFSYSLSISAFDLLKLSIYTFSSSAIQTHQFDLTKSMIAPLKALEFVVGFAGIEDRDWRMKNPCLKERIPLEWIGRCKL